MTESKSDPEGVSLVVREGSRDYARLLERLRAASRGLVVVGGEVRQRADGAKRVADALKLTVHRIDLSEVASKYIGETEKNLSRVFEKAAAERWILFFDEADALFGKRSDVSSSHDRYANQEVAWLIERIANHPGICVLASNAASSLPGGIRERVVAVIDTTV